MEATAEGAMLYRYAVYPFPKDILLNAEAFTKPKVWKLTGPQASGNSITK
jgi:hypothetical protein